MGKLEQTYAQSLFELAKEKGIVENVYREYDDFQEFLETNSTVFSILKNPQIQKEEKKSILTELLKDSSDIFRNYVQVLVDKKREKLMTTAFADFKALFFEESGKKEVIVHTAQSLSDEQRVELQTILRDRFQREIVLQEVLQPDLIMGFRILADGKELDCSLDGAFHRLKGRLKQMNGVTM
ncbi:MAG: ATP synthase F1 subunit delta [Tissierellia bacterium]|nr:ATP synthase F1 subunit delta [Tissierellia bacterium]